MASEAIERCDVFIAYSMYQQVCSTIIIGVCVCNNNSWGARWHRSEIDGVKTREFSVTESVSMT